MGQTWLNCENFRAMDEIIAALGARAADIPPRELILLFNYYNEALLREKRHPNRSDLDSVSRNQKVYLMHFTMRPRQIVGSRGPISFGTLFNEPLVLGHHRR